MPREGRQGKVRQGSRAAQRRNAPRKTSARTTAHTPHTIAVVGAGRLGTALALALDGAGFNVAALVAQHSAHARRAAQLFKRPRPRAFAAHELSALPASDLLLIATPDDEIAATAARLAEINRELKDQHARD